MTEFILYIALFILIYGGLVCLCCYAGNKKKSVLDQGIADLKAGRVRKVKVKRKVK